MKLLASIIISFNCIQLFNCAEMGNFYAPELIRKGDNFWLNCTVFFDTNEKDYATIRLLKDHQEFYKYNAHSQKTELNSVLGVRRENVDPSDIAGKVRVRNASRQTAGSYACNVTIKRDSPVLLSQLTAQTTVNFLDSSRDFGNSTKDIANSFGCSNLLMMALLSYYLINLV